MPPTVNPWNNTQASGLRKDDKNSLADGASCPTTNTTFMPEQRNRGKRDPTTPDTNKENPSGRQRQKKPRRGVKVDTAPKEKKDLGMFYLRNPPINPADIFPKDMPEKLCANFTCKGKECTNTNCDFAHPRKALELKCEMIILIANQFIKKYVGWFNKYHFMRMPNITEGAVGLLPNLETAQQERSVLILADQKLLGRKEKEVCVVGRLDMYRTYVLLYRTMVLMAHPTKVRR